VVFLDEPTTGLDPQMRHGVWELLRRLNREEGKTIVLTTHYMEEAELLAERVAIIDHGQIRAIDTPRNLIARLDGVGRIEFAMPNPVEIADLEGLDGIAGAATRSNGRQAGTLAPTVYELRVTEPKAAVTSLLTWSEAEASTCAAWRSSPERWRTCSLS
jgi:ABC-2 type transport system ATP-binding protein